MAPWESHRLSPDQRGFAAGEWSRLGRTGHRLAAVVNVIWGPFRRSDLYESEASRRIPFGEITGASAHWIPPNSWEPLSYLFDTDGRAQDGPTARSLEHGGMDVSLKKTAPTGDYLDPRSFAELLDLSRETVYRLIARGELRAFRVGSAIRLPRRQLDSLLSADSEDNIDGSE